MRTSHLLSALALFCLFAGAAHAQDAAGACTKKLSMVNEIQMESRGAGPSSVPVEINGKKHSLTFATAGTATQITEDTAKALGLNITADGEVALFDSQGKAQNNQVTVSKFTMGTLEGTNMKMAVSPSGGRGGFGGGGAGLFSLNHMLPYDVDVDFGTDKLRFFSQDHCPGGVLYWQASAVGVAPITVDAGRITIPVELDGKPMTGVIDTAATGVSIKTAVAEKVLGLAMGSADAPATTPGNYSRTVGSFRMGTLGLRNIKVAIEPNGARLGGGPAMEAMNRSRAAQAALASPEVQIGMDLLRKLHLYMAFGEKKLYITPASPKPAAATAAPASPPAN
jgi:predicted aspartyl protease